MRNQFKVITISMLVLCIVLCMVPFAYATNSIGTVRNLKIDIPVEYHAPNTPQYSDVLTAELTLLEKDLLDPNQIVWYRHYSAKYDEEGKIIKQAYYLEIGRGLTYTVKAEDYRHSLKCESLQYNLSAVTEVVDKKDYGKPVLHVVNNSYYGDTDGSIYFLDQRMEYTHDQQTIHSVETDRGVLYSGDTMDNLNPKGYTWLVRFKGSELEKQSEWTPYTIAAGQKIALESLSISQNELALNPAQNSAILSVGHTPEHAYIVYGSWHSSDESVATVDENGRVQALYDGKAVITYTANRDCPDAIEQSVSCTVTVSGFDYISSVNIVEESIHMSITDNHLRRNLETVIYPETAKNCTVTWSSDSPEICHVENGVITAVSPGNATITCTVEQNGVVLSDSIPVTIDPPPSVGSDSSWAKLSREDMVFEFEAFPIDDNIVVSIEKADGTAEEIYPGNYKIEGNKLIIDHEYLKYLPEGDNRVTFTMPGKSKVEIVPASSSAGSAPLITRLTGNGSTPSIRTIDSDSSGDASLSFTFSVFNYKVYPEYKILSPKNARAEDPSQPEWKVKIRTDMPSSEVNRLEASSDAVLISNKQEDSQGVFYEVRVNENALKNGPVHFTLTSETGEQYHTEDVTIQGFLESAAFTQALVTLDYKSGHKLDIRNYLSTVPELSGLIKAGYLKESDFSWVKTTDLTNAYCTLDGSTIRAIKDTIYDKPIGIRLTLRQESDAYTGGSKSISLDIKVNIKLFELLRRDHEGQWEPLGKVGLNFLIGGVDETFTTIDRKHPQVVITNSQGKNIPINYNPSSKYSYKLTVNPANGTINVELPYIFLWLQHTGFYAISFKFYDPTGTYIESTVNTNFTIYPSGTPLTGDAFSPVPYLFALICVLPLAFCLVYILRNGKKEKLK